MMVVWVRWLGDSVPDAQPKRLGKLVDDIIQAKAALLEERMARTSLNALRAMASMQSRPLPFLTTVGYETTIIGQIRYELPTTGDLSTRYDPVSVAANYANAGADAVAIFTDSVIEYNGITDFTLASEALKPRNIPLISQDYILHEYSILEMRAAGASVVQLHCGTLPPDKLRQLMATIHRNRMTAVIDVYNAEQLALTLDWSPQVIGIGGNGPFSFGLNLDRAAALREHIPNAQRVMITRPLHTWDDVAAAAQLRPHAVILTNMLMLGSPLNEVRAQFQHATH